MTDRNKTPLTHRVTATAVAFLDGMFCRPIETEVQVDQGWVADIATFLEPTMTASRKLKLHDRFIDGEFVKRADIYRGYGRSLEYYEWPLTVIVEVKTTRQDFLKDVKGKFERSKPAHLCFLAYPTDIVRDNEIPKGWGALRMTKDGKRIFRRPRQPRVEPQHPGHTIRLLAEIAKRRDSRTRRKAFRDWMKAYRMEDSERKKRYTVNQVVIQIVRWLTSRDVSLGEDLTLKDILDQVGVRVDGWMKERVEKAEELRDMLLMIEGD